METRLVKLPIYDDIESEHLLTPLLDGKTVVLAINDPRMRLKKRAQKPVVLIAPVTLYGMEGRDVMISLPGYGCEVVTPGHIKPMQLYRLGMTVSTCKILSTTLNQLFEKQHT